MYSLQHSTRRQFVIRTAKVVGVGATLPTFVLRSALAAPQESSDERIVVGLLLTGGPDGLSLVPPYADDAYYQHRKTLGLSPEVVLKLNDHVGLHPSLKPVRQMYDEGKAAVILGTGYPNFNLSHFVGRDIWESATTRDVSGKPGATGWLGRYVDVACRGVNDPTLNVAVGPGRMPLLVTGRDHPGVGFASPESFRFSGVKSPGGHSVYGKLHELTMAKPEDDLQYITQTAINANSASAKLCELAERYHTTVEYPDTLFGNSVRTIAGFINGGLNARAYYAAQGIAVFGGYDTHADQIRRLGVLLDELSQTVSAFYQDLARCGNDRRVLTFTFSEFGRRVQENFSGGTDHGLAQPMFLFGSGVKPGVHGRQPSLTDLDDRGNLKMQSDFREVYAAILEKWLDTDSEPILGQRYTPLDCVA
jgi:uncharacterized protein (DUF1501 family)